MLGASVSLAHSNPNLGPCISHVQPTSQTAVVGMPFCHAAYGLWHMISPTTIHSLSNPFTST